MSTDTERGAFLSAIRAEPADDTARLVFADWLDEHGEPERAEFIRLQVDRAQYSPRAAVVLYHAQQRELQKPCVAGAHGACPFCAKTARMGALWKAHVEKWLDNLPAYCPNVVPEPDCEVITGMHGETFRYTFRRGFLDTVECSYRAWAVRADEIRAAHPLRHVRVSEVPDFELLTLANVRALDFYRCAGRIVEVRPNAMPEHVLAARWPGLTFERVKYGRVLNVTAEMLFNGTADQLDGEHRRRIAEDVQRRELAAIEKLLNPQPVKPFDATGKSIPALEADE